MNRTDRLYALTEALRAAGPRGRSAAWLALRFEVSARTIKRDVAALLQAGVPVVGQDGRGGGYQLASRATLPPLAFTGGEAIAIAVALAAVPDLPFGADGRAALTKIASAMTDFQRAEATALARRIWLRAPAPRARPSAAKVVDEALRQGVAVSIDYADAAARRSSRRIVEPLSLANTGGAWYLLAWCRKRAAGRWFRLDRIRAARLTRETCTERDVRAVFGEPPADAQPVQLRISW